MKRVSIPEPHKIELIDDDLPALGADDVLIDVRVIGICGSDLHTLEGKHPFVEYPVLPGHEVAGEIRAVGTAVDLTLVGKRVALEPSIVQGEMPKFEPGRYNIATGLKVMGFQAPGGMAEQFVVPRDRVHVLPEDFDYELGAGVEPAAVAVHGVRIAESVAGRDVAVIGAGTIGLLVAQVARAYGAASVTIAELDESRRAIARDLNLTTVEQLADQAYDVVFECVGVEATLRSSIRACRKGATVVIIGVFGDDVSIPAGLIQDWELRLLGSLMYVSDDYREAIRLLHTGNVQIKPLITHRFPLHEALQAFETAQERGNVLKVLLQSG